MPYYDCIPPTPRKTAMSDLAPAVHWTIYITDEKQDSFDVAFFGTAAQAKVKAEGLVKKLQSAGLASEVRLDLRDKGHTIFNYTKGRWAVTMDGLLLDFSNRDIPPRPSNEKFVL